MEVKRIGLKELKEQVIIPALSKTSFRYRVLTSTGAYGKAYRTGNLRVGTITALLQVTESELLLLGGGMTATALNATLRFLIPVNDINDPDGSYAIVEKFREELAEVLTITQKIVLKLDTGDGVKTYTGAVSSSFPVGGSLDIRQSLGNSFEYTCYMEFAYLQNALNASDTLFYLDGDTTPIPYTRYSMARKNTLTANSYSSDSAQTARNYAESSVFAVEIAMPALDSTTVTGAAVNGYLMGVSAANAEHKLTIKRAGITVNETVIFGDIMEVGQGAENLSWQLSLVPYIPSEDDTADEV